MLFEILSTAEATANAAAMVAVVALAFATTTRGRLGVVAVLAGWFVLVLALGSTGMLDNQTAPPRIAFAVAVPLALLCAAFFRFESIRTALFAIPLPALIAANAMRVLGVDFLLLYAAHRLPAPFAPSAGWGDVFVGAMALPVAWALARFGSRMHALVAVWNTIGVVDLVLALGFGATSAPGPMQIFSSPPDAVSMTSLPWLLIPGFLVPIYLSLHVAIFYRLSRANAASSAAGVIQPAPGPVGAGAMGRN